MVLRFNDAIFNLKCKTKGNWEGAEFHNSHELFRKTRKDVLGLFPFHPFPMDEYFNQQHDKKNVKTVYVRLGSKKVSNQAPSLQSFSLWFAAMIGKQARMETWMLINRTRWTTGSIHQPICICYHLWTCQEPCLVASSAGNLHDKHAPKLLIFSHIQWHVWSQALMLKMKPKSHFIYWKFERSATKNGNRKWHQAFTSEQCKVYSIAFVFSLPRAVAHARRLRKRCPLLAGNRAFRQK